MPSLEDTAAALGRAAEALPEPSAFDDEADRALAARLRARLTRDLLPRVSGGAPVVLAAIAGPNNVGKSSLFNALAGQVVSTARAEGGLTKQCVAVVHPSLWAGPLEAVLSRRYEVVPVAPGEVAPVDVPGPPGRLYLETVEALPPTVLLMDTPDFDSVHLENRVNAEALLVTVDLVIFVVSRQTYRNAAVVEFLRAAVGHGRPYLLVYNEAPRVEQARAHLDTLAADVGQPPLGRYFAAHQPGVESGEAPLRTQPVDGGPTLESRLFDPAQAQALKARALEAGLRDAAAELRALARASAAQVAEPERLRGRLRHELRQVGMRAALRAVPADVLIEAFREELDARSRYHRWVRMPFRALASALGFVGRKVASAVAGDASPARPPGERTEALLADGVRQVLETLGPELGAWRGDARLRAALADALGEGTLKRLERPLEVPGLEEDRRRLHDYCRQLIGDELSSGAVHESVLQALTTLLYSAPAGAAAAITVVTTGVGNDAAVWVASALSAPLFEKLVDMLGSTIRTRVTRTWAEGYGQTLAAALESQLFAPLLGALDEAVVGGTRVSSALEEAAAGLGV